MTRGQQKTYLILGAITIATVVSVGVTVGVVVSKRKRTEEFEKLLAIIEDGNASQTGGKGSAWDTSLYNSNPSKKTINFSVLKQYAKTIHDAKGAIMPDDEPKVIGVFNQLQNIYDVSALSFAFFQSYGEDLYMYLSSFMDNTDVYFSDRKNYMEKIKERVNQIS